ncbi:MAG: phosphomethylpyrimidine synthase ThiC, partial [Candidatus Wallbacteria bacterium]|nr:phosphomethylpyrimidine synthase ThiC [Candidatus Wallbacteria bacterium]
MPLNPEIIKNDLAEAIKSTDLTLDEALKNFQTGTMTLIRNPRRQIRPLAVGKNMPTAVNINIGTSGDLNDPDLELKKVEVAEKWGADTLMDLSTGGDLPAIRKVLLAESKLPLGTVPIYEMYVTAMRKYGSFSKMQAEEMLDIIESQAVEGVDFMTIHSGVTRSAIEVLKRNSRVLGIVSRGGSFTAGWIAKNGMENPLFERFDDLLAILSRYRVVLSLGDGLRPGAIFDATDQAQIHELSTLADLRRRAMEAGVQVMIEGPGHVPLNQIRANVELEKSLCGGAPFYVLGPLPLDVAPGY